MNIRNTILVVDDEEMLRHYMRQILKLACPQMEIVTAENGVIGNQFFIEHHKEIALVITDNDMPGGISGVTLIKLMKKVDGSIPIIMATSRDDLQNHGANLLIPKPYPQIEKFVEIIKSFVPQIPTSPQ